MLTKRKHIGFFITAIALAAPACAFAMDPADTLSIPANVQPSAESQLINSSKTPDIANVPSAERPEGNAKTADYQKTVLGNSYMTPFGRAESATEDEKNSAVISPATENDMKISARKTATDLMLQHEATYNRTHQDLKTNSAQSDTIQPKEQEQP